MKRPHISSPPALIGLAALTRMAFAATNFANLSAQLLARSQHDQQDATALLDLSTILHLTGWRELGLAMQKEALATQQIFTLHPKSGRTTLRVLTLLCDGDLTQNNAIEFLLEDANLSLDLFYFSPGASPTHLQNGKYDLIFVAVCEAERNRPLLTEIGEYLKDCPLPVVNLPAHISRLARDEAASLLPSQAGLCMPVTARLDRATLLQLVDGSVRLAKLLPDSQFPLIVRPVDSHKGQALAKLDTLDDLQRYLSEQQEAHYYLAPYLDYRSPDGQFRKYRIVLISGRPYVCHVAISSHWIVHYMSAGMKESPEKRAEEAEVMRDFDQNFAVRHGPALQQIADHLALDYVGLDCAENQQGDLVIFEFDSGMTVHAMDPVDLFPYKQPQMRKVFAAFAAMLAAKAAGQ